MSRSSMEDGFLEAKFENLQVADEATAELGNVQVTNETTAEISHLSRKATSPWREWLNTKFPTAGRASDLSLLISTKGQSIPFESIKETQAAVLEVYTNNQRGGSCLKDYKVGILRATPGAGKTRTLVQLHHNTFGARVFIISFNNGNSPMSFDVEYGAEYSMCLRFMHSVYAAHIKFEEFITLAYNHKLIPDNSKTPESLTFLQTLDFLTEGIPPENRIIAIDEFNELLVDDRMSRYLLEFGSLLTKVCVTKSTVLLAATTSLDLQPVLKNSNVSYKYIPLFPFSSAHKHAIIDRYAEKYTNLLSWRKARKFRMLLNFVGGIPRCFEYMLAELDRWVDVPMDKWAYDTILKKIQEAANKYTIPLACVYQLAEDVVLGSKVDPSSRVKGSDQTYEAMQMTCSILLIPVGTKATVSVSYMSLIDALSTPEAAAHQVLADLRDLMMGGGILGWQLFENFVCQFESIRSRLHVTSCLNHKVPEVTIGAYYACKLEKCSALEIKINPSPCNALKAAKRWPAPNKNFDWEADRENPPPPIVCATSGSKIQITDNFVILNGEGTPFADIFRTLRVGPGPEFSRFLILIQCKWLQKTELTNDTILEELAKNKRSMDGLKLKLGWENTEYLTVFMASRVHKGVVLADESYIVLGPDDFPAYFGPTLNERALYLSSTKLQVNTATYTELQTIPGLGRTKARSIIQARDALPAGFSDKAMLIKHAKISDAMAENFEF